MKLQKSVQITLIITIAVIALVVIGIIFLKPISSSNTISVNGQATEKVIPDLVSIYFNVETKGTTSSEAESANSEIVNKLKNSITALGFSENEIKTENYNIYPEYNYKSSTREITGYRASHSLRVEFSTSEQNKIGSVIDAGANAGAGISYINFELSPSLEQQYKAEAIKTASEDAKIKAEAIAQGFDKELGKLVSVSLDNFNYNPWRVFSASGSSAGIAEDQEMAKEAVTSITPSEREVTAYVTAVYKLK